jgi:hypothetical protein
MNETKHGSGLELTSATSQMNETGDGEVAPTLSLPNPIELGTER